MRKIALLFILFLSAVINSEIVEEIVAVVGKEVITNLELEEQVFLLTQLGMEVTPEGVLQQMIEDRILLEEAKGDTTITVGYKEIKEELTRRMEKIKSNYPSEEEFKLALKNEGLTLSAFEQKSRDIVRNELFVQKWIERHIKPEVTVTGLEIQRFYEAYRDSIKPEPEKVRLAHILLPISPSDKTISKAEDRVGRIFAEIKAGKKFSDAARAFSDDSITAARGGDFGYLERGDLRPELRELEETLFALKVGEITVLSSNLGFHIFKCEAQKDGGKKFRHILVGVVPSISDTLKIKKLAKKILDRLKKGEDFGELAEEYSADENTKGKGGDLGFQYMPILPLSFKQAVENTPAGEVYTQPVLSEWGYHIIKVLDRIAEMERSFEEVKEHLYNMLIQKKLGEKHKKWIDKLSKKVYVENRLK